ncbi:MAG: adenylate kinase [Bacteriovoracaceae bacterium]|nr:adenylate kinase [Bacteriovoracaceae bacterium]
MKHLILIGAPGSGKGTQAGKLVAENGLKHVSTGDLLRSEIAKGTDLGKQVKSVLDAGSLVSDELVIKLLQANTDLDKFSYIFDGYPRNLAQAETLDKEVLKGRPSLAVYFEIDLLKLVQRLTNRRTCKDCGSIYNLVTQAPKTKGACDKCGSTNLVHREDDQESVIKKRMQIFSQNTEPVLNYYKAANRLVTVNAENSIEQLYQQISTRL